MTTRRDCFGVPPVAAISARLRCCLRALTANAGPASSTTSISAITTISARTAMVASSVLPSCTSAGISEAGGGSSITARDATVAPMSLSWRTVAHETGPPSTSHERLAAGVDAEGAERAGRDREVAHRRRLGDPDDRRVGRGVVRGELEAVADPVALVEPAPG